MNCRHCGLPIRRITKGRREGVLVTRTKHETAYCPRAPKAIHEEER